MIALNEKELKTLSNAWGRDSTSYYQQFQITDDDVGVSRQNYLKEGTNSYTFTKKDVGRKISVITGKPYKPYWNSPELVYTSWSFYRD
ncbi:MAG: hypothetical protein WC679_02135 [Bacteroidales bacterium]|jgi:hypothetical protein